ncbi:hypothetical protein NLM16_31350 [Bradyrhizobium brasilense]|uniref:hypothetical protein n=1 Tax=Bradyrhizobium brasilense TaxID=1419277 RepID=UPI002877F6BC|nr:hypothetical protein [Bradyrhizobium brasilense]MCP3418615.1 hypothetical protein [Bradyrhizobium brasilense]
MNAIIPTRAFDLTADRFDSFVSSAFAASRESRHVRDRLIAQVDDGRLDHMLLRARSGVVGLSDKINRKAALNVIDFAFESIVMQNMSTDQAIRYLGAVENMLHIREARGLDPDGPLWVDTVHHVCVFSVLFQLAVFVDKNRKGGQMVLLHQGQRPEPRLRIVADLLRRAHGVTLILQPLQGNWFARLRRLTTPDTVIYYLTDMPLEAFPQATRRERGRSRLLLTLGQGPVLQVETVSGSQSFARRLEARRIVLDYPSSDSLRIRPIGADEAAVSICPLEDWLFWPLLGTARQQAVAHNGVACN